MLIVWRFAIMFKQKVDVLNLQRIYSRLSNIRMEFLNSLMEPSTSNAGFPIQAIHSVNLTNLTLSGAKMFENPADKSRFMAEFSQVQLQNPHWSPVRLIRERLQIQMKIKNERLFERRGQQKKSVSGSTKRKLKETDSIEDELQEELFGTLNDRLINSVNEQIENDHFIELDESNTISAHANNVLLINDGNGKCLILDCGELLAQNRDNLQSVNDIRWTNKETNGSISKNKQKRKRIIDSEESHFETNSVVTRSGRIKHACQHCNKMFTNTNSFTEHMKEAHVFEELDDELNDELDEDLDVKPDQELLNSIIGCSSRNS
ncbi:hypothetical protein M3Y97_00445700 [Aphelenchoides bicaudatus]|nr:hypothetical protein M3Y97_00445700 [Aphelenchoides bicaudatus]